MLDHDQPRVVEVVAIPNCVEREIMGSGMEGPEMKAVAMGIQILGPKGHKMYFLWGNILVYLKTGTAI